MTSRGLAGLLAAGLLGCATTPDDGFPVQPGAQPAVPGTTGVGKIAGRVCVLLDPRVVGTCATSGAGGLTVTLGDQITTTADDGSFTITPAAGANLAFTVSGPSVVTTTTPSATTTIPVLPASLLDQMSAANAVTVAPGTGSILASVTRAGLAAAGITALAAPPPAFGPFFDGTSATVWALDATGVRGVVWIPGITTGLASLTLLEQGSSEALIEGIPIIDGGISFVDASLP